MTSPRRFPIPFAAVLLLLIPSAALAGTGPRLALALQRGFQVVPVTTPSGTTVHRPEPIPAPGAVQGAAGDAARLEVLVLGRPSPQELADLGVRVRSRAGDVITATAPIASLPGLAARPSVRSVRLPAPFRPCLDVSLPEIGVTQLRTRVDGAWSGRTGRGVIVGIVDSGVDVDHGDFRTESGTRVLRYWSQRDASGSPPEAFDLDYGTEWTREQIDAGLAADVDEFGHGTHVAGIAAGNGRAGSAIHGFQLAGVAPEADLVVVQTDLREDHIIDAVRYVFDVAALEGRPAVVNLSLGSQYGPHDGTTPLDLALEELTGPGRLAVAAAGNEGNDWIHGEIEVPAGGADSASFTATYLGDPDDTFNFFDIEAYFAGSMNLQVTVVTPAGKRFGPYPPGWVQPDTLTGEGTLFLSYAGPDPENGSYGIFMEVSDTDPGGAGRPPSPPAQGTWRVVFANPGAEAREVDLWIPLAFPMSVRWTESAYDPSEEIPSPGSSRGVITVGSYNNRDCWLNAEGERCTSVTPALSAPGRITWFSSNGPTRDGREKPELTAPGFVVSAAFSHDVPPGVADTLLGVPLTLQPDGEHIVQAGTSAAAPHVAGALALALEAIPDLDPETARAKLIASARKDAFSGDTWNGAAGHGKLDAKGLIDLVPVLSGSLHLQAAPGGEAVLEWDASGDASIAGFRLESRAGAAWSPRARFAGPGPHRWLDLSPTAGTRYRLWAGRRQGGEDLWAEAAWRGSGSPALGPPTVNPFRSETAFRLGASKGDGAGRVLAIVDARGRAVRRIPVGPGEGVVRWDGRDATGLRAAPGIYWARLDGERAAPGRRVVLLP